MTNDLYMFIDATRPNRIDMVQKPKGDYQRSIGGRVPCKYWEGTEPQHVTLIPLDRGPIFSHKWCYLQGTRLSLTYLYQSRLARPDLLALFVLFASRPSLENHKLLEEDI